MALPEGPLTPAQHEILDAVWAHGRKGATVAAIWETVAASRPVARTTVLNQVERLERRGWLVRQRGDGALRYTAALGRERTAALLARSFVDDFFGGSASDLVQSLLGSRRLGREEIARLRRMLDGKLGKETSP